MAAWNAGLIRTAALTEKAIRSTIRFQFLEAGCLRR